MVLHVQRFRISCESVLLAHVYHDLNASLALWRELFRGDIQIHRPRHGRAPLRGTGRPAPTDVIPVHPDPVLVLRPGSHEQLHRKSVRRHDGARGTALHQHGGSNSKFKGGYPAIGG